MTAMTKVLRGERKSAEVRRRALVDEARQAFFRQGYGGTTLSSIAAMAGGSKSTLWNNFSSKEALFEAVVADIVDQYGETLSIDLPVTDDVCAVLRRFAAVYLDMMLLEPILSLSRLVVGEAGRFPNLAEVFYECGPRRGKERLANWMSASMVEGYLRVGDADRAAGQFVGLCQSGLYQKAILNLPVDIDNAARVSDIEAAVHTFYRAWSPCR